MLKGRIIGVVLAVLTAVVGIFLVIVIGVVVWHFVVLQPSPDPEFVQPTTTTAKTTTEATQPVDAPGQLYFTGKVLEVTEDSVLMECYDKDKFDTVWVYVASIATDPQVGEEYLVTYEDMMMPSLPPRITAVQMEKQ